MPKIEKGDLSEWQDQAKGPTKGYRDREALRMAIEGLDDKSVFRLTPEEGEDLKALKYKVRWAARDLDKKIAYQENGRGAIIVRLATEEGPKKAEVAGKGALKPS